MRHCSSSHIFAKEAVQQFLLPKHWTAWTFHNDTDLRLFEYLWSAFGKRAIVNSKNYVDF